MRYADFMRCRADLRRIQAGDWCLLFSHPEDFDEQGFERDRWLLLVREAFAARRVLPAALDAPGAGRQHGWLWAIDPRSRFVAESVEEAASATRVVSLFRDASPPDRRQPTSPAVRRVVFVDPAGRCRWVYGYAPGTRPVSVFDLLAMIERLESSPGDVERPAVLLRRAAQGP
jgi:hypothetical protein